MKIWLTGTLPAATLGRSMWDLQNLYGWVDQMALVEPCQPFSVGEFARVKCLLDKLNKMAADFPDLAPPQIDVGEDGLEIAWMRRNRSMVFIVEDASGYPRISATITQERMGYTHSCLTDSGIFGILAWFVGGDYKNLSLAYGPADGIPLTSCT